MAKRFGGKYSPNGQGSGAREEVIDPRQIKAAGSPARALYLPAVILVFFSLGSGPATLVTALIGAAVLTLAAWMLQEGLKAEAEYNARKVARRPAVPRKMLASALTGIGAAIAAYTGDSGVVGSVLYGIAA
ncbi:MAG: hypothetical protein AAFY14_12965, partial [Pseudomonadota bacterium]